MLRNRTVHSSLLAMFAFPLALFLTTCLAVMVASAQDDTATATVLVAKLNVRSGPGTGYARIGQVSAGDVLTVTGQAQNCAWLKVQTGSLNGWASGQRQYVQLDAPCSQIAAAEVDIATGSATSGGMVTATVTAPTATPAATPEVTSEATTVAEATASPTLTPATEDPLPPGMGCFLIINHVGPELNVTTTNKDNGRSGNFKVPAGGETVWCLDPGSYALTIDAPPPWDDINTDIKISAGERFEWTIGRKE